MAEGTLFNIPIDEVNRQLRVRKGFDYDSSDSGPISTQPNETLEPVIRGGEKILQDPDLRNMVKEVILSSPKKR